MKLHILKGCHYSTFIPTIHCTRRKDVFEISRRVQFTASMMYEVDEPSLVNKLFGFCFGFGVHKYSVRIGWTYDKAGNRFVLWEYLYDNGKLIKRHLTSFNTVYALQNPIDVYVRIKKAAGQVNVETWVEDNLEGRGKRTDELLNCFVGAKWPNFVTMLGLYFGGNTPAPHHMTMDMKRI